MSAPVFGKRQTATHRHAALSPAVAASDEHAAFFAAVRAEMAPSRDEARKRVPRSFKAALLAGLVVGCALAGFQVTSSLGGTGTASPSPFTSIAAALGTPADALPTATPIDLAPVIMLVGLLGGARVAALTVTVVRMVLNAVGTTSRAAYVVGGAGFSATLAAALLVGFGYAPPHGWIVEVAAGAAAAFLYRMFAGVRSAA